MLVIYNETVMTGLMTLVELVSEAHEDDREKAQAEKGHKPLFETNAIGSGMVATYKDSADHTETHSQGEGYRPPPGGLTAKIKG
jgi:hypothetical protein